MEDTVSIAFFSRSNFKVSIGSFFLVTSIALVLVAFSLRLDYESSLIKYVYRTALVKRDNQLYKYKLHQLPLAETSDS